jgi:hypothetical protein
MLRRTLIVVLTLASAVAAAPARAQTSAAVDAPPSRYRFALGLGRAYARVERYTGSLERTWELAAALDGRFETGSVLAGAALEGARSFDSSNDVQLVGYYGARRPLTSTFTGAAAVQGGAHFFSRGDRLAGFLPVVGVRLALELSAAPSRGAWLSYSQDLGRVSGSTGIPYGGSVVFVGVMLPFATAPRVAAPATEVAEVEPSPPSPALEPDRARAQLQPPARPRPFEVELGLGAGAATDRAGGPLDGRLAASLGLRLQLGHVLVGVAVDHAPAPSALVFGDQNSDTLLVGYAGVRLPLREALAVTAAAQAGWHDFERCGEPLERNCRGTGTMPAAGLRLGLARVMKTGSELTLWLSTATDLRHPSSSATGETYGGTVALAGVSVAIGMFGPAR